MFANRLKRSNSRPAVIEEAPIPSAPTNHFDEQEKTILALINEHENKIAAQMQESKQLSKEKKYKALAVVNEQLNLIEKTYQVQQDAKKAWKKYTNPKKKMINERIAEHQKYLESVQHYLQQIKDANTGIVKIINSYYLSEAVFPDLEQQKQTITTAKNDANNAKSSYQDEDVILESSTAIESLQIKFDLAIQQSQTDKNAIFVRKDLTLTEKLASMSDIDNALTAELKTIHQQVIIERTRIEDRIALIKSIEDEADGMLDDMRKEAAYYQRAYPGLQAAVDIKAYKLPVVLANTELAKGTLKLTKESLQEDALILNLPTVTEQRLALYRREKASNLVELKTARLTMQEKSNDRRNLLSVALKSRVASILREIAATEENAKLFCGRKKQQNADDQRDKCQHLIKELEKYSIDPVSSPTLSVWQAISESNALHQDVIFELEFFELQNEVASWSATLAKHTHDKNHLEDYQKIWEGLNNKIERKEFKEFRTFKGGFNERKERDEQQIAAAHEERLPHTTSLKNLIQLLQNEKDALSANAVPETDVRHRLLGSVIGYLADHQHNYLTKVLGGSSKEIQEKAFYDGVKNIIENQFIQNKGLRALSKHSERNAFVRWYFKLINRIHRALPDLLKSKATREQRYRQSFFASKQEIAVAKMLEEASNTLTAASNAIAGRAAKLS